MPDFERDLTRFSQPIHSYDSLDQFLTSAVPPGVVSIAYGDGFLDLLLMDRGAATTIVVFHAAAGDKVKSTPIFSALGVTEALDANVIAVSDPSLDLGLGLAWFAGNSEQALQRDLVGVLQHAIGSFAEHRHLVFFGPSGGGFAALFYASKFEGSLAIAVNPQTSIGEYHDGPVDAYVEAAWGEERTADVEAVTDVAGVYAGAIRNTVAYVQNAEDGHHLNRHMLPWLEQLGGGRDEVWSLLGDWGSGHQAPPVALTRSLLEGVCAAAGDWSKALADGGFRQAPSADDAASDAERVRES